MAESVFPMRPTEIDPEPEPRLVSLDDAGTVFDVLSSRTAREMIAALDTEPMTPSTLADRVGTSLQNASYHLDRLSAAGLVEVVGTSFSERGNEMDVYATTSIPVVVYVDGGTERDAGGAVADDERPPVGRAESD